MAYDLSTTKILIVDVMAPMLGLTKSILNIFGFKLIYLAHNADEAKKIIIQKDPDLIITDWIMEPMDGLEFTKNIRKDPMTPNPYVPVIMMTGFSSKLRVEAARDCGITEFLVKPFTAKDLYNRIIQIIEKPRQFVDSGAFFGPDRRRKFIVDYSGPRRRDVDKEAKNPSEKEKSAIDILKKLRSEAKNLSDS
jgi:CheY-like chemotaxis protein